MLKTDTPDLQATTATLLQDHQHQHRRQTARIIHLQTATVKFAQALNTLDQTTTIQTEAVPVSTDQTTILQTEVVLVSTDQAIHPRQEAAEASMAVQEVAEASAVAAAQEAA